MRTIEERYGEATAELVRAAEAIRAMQVNLDSWYREYEAEAHSSKGYLRDRHAAAKAQLSSQAKTYAGSAIAHVEAAAAAFWGDHG